VRRKLALAAFALPWSASAYAIPPALSDDSARMTEANLVQNQLAADLESPDSRALVESFFEVIGEGELFDLNEIFFPDAVYVTTRDGAERIVDGLDDDGFLSIPQWEMISLFRLSDSWAAAAEARLQPVGIEQAVLKFQFARVSSGELRISSIEEVRL
jgi:hypothetical protein